MRLLWPLVFCAAACPTDRPPARSRAASVLLPATNQVYLYGGRNSSGNFADPEATLWRYHFGACAGWSRTTFDRALDTPDAVTAVAFDSKRNRLIYAGTSLFALDSDRLTFSHLQPVGTPAVATDRQWAIYDAEHDRVISGGFGAQQLSFAGSSDGQWQPIDFLESPALLTTVAAAVDSSRSALYAYDAEHGALHVYWLFLDRGADVVTSGDPLPQDLGARLAYDALGERLLLLSGSDVYALDAADGTGSTLTVRRLTTSGAPLPPRSDAAFVVSGSLGLLFGGVTADRCALDDTWYLSDETAWSAQAPATTCL
jgi:hypothetical protein